MSTVYDALKKAEGQKTKGMPMKKNIVNILLLIAVIIIFSFAFWKIYGLMNPPKPVVVVVPKPVVAPVVVKPVVSVEKPAIVVDPYILGGTINGSNPMAVINGKLMKVNDHIDDLVLIKIEPRQVLLQNAKDNSSLILKIK